MTKDGLVGRAGARKVMKKNKNEPSEVPPKDHRQRQMSSILAGLRHLKAPVVSCLALAMRLLGGPQHVGLITLKLGNCRQ